MENRPDRIKSPLAPDPQVPTRGIEILEQRGQPALTHQIVEQLVTLQERINYLMRELSLGYHKYAKEEAGYLVDESITLHNMVIDTLQHIPDLEQPFEELMQEADAWLKAHNADK